MKIKSLILENFRAYKTRTTIPFSQMTGFIGRNDAGKSTILEALDIFFEGGTCKIDPGDASIGGNAREVRIAVVFSDLPEEIVLDSNALTTFSAEHLLNSEGDLEIHKIFNCSNQTPKPTIYARAIHPTATLVQDILQKSQADLRRIVKERDLENNCNKAENPSMRQAIYRHAGDLGLVEQDISLNADNGKAIWTALQSYLPIFALFQSNRASNDQDPEVQNPMKVAIEQALDEVEEQLAAIASQVESKAQETALRTLAKLQASYPEIASTLQPRFKKPSWKTIFKLDPEADEGIPLNKRGSGVRRLVLLSFFQAEAEKRRAESGGEGKQRRSVVYAIEEPETSQHPDNQKRIITALRGLSAAGDQVILTTHVPALASLLPVDSLRFVDHDPETRQVRVRTGDEGEHVYQAIAETLGILPEPLANRSVQVAVLVEGKTDIDAFKSMINVLDAAGKIGPIAEDRIFWTIGGGDQTLQDWVERRYLDRLNIPIFMLQDSDRTSDILPITQKKQEWLLEMRKRPDVSAFLTRKRSIDNYLHPDAVSRLTNGLLAFPANTDFNFSAMADILSQILTEARKTSRQTGFDYRPIDHQGVVIGQTGKSACKRIISTHIMTNMTAEEILERMRYLEDGVEKFEILEWVEAIRSHL